MSNTAAGGRHKLPRTTLSAEMTMYIGNSSRFVAGRASGILALTLLATTLAVASEQGESRGSLLALTSLNEPATNQVPVFELMTVGTLAVSLVQMLSTGGKGAISE